MMKPAAVASVAIIASVSRPRIMPESYQAIFRRRSVARAARTTKKQRLMIDSRMNVGALRGPSGRTG